MHICTFQLTTLFDFQNFLVCEAQTYVLWFQIGVDDFTHAMEIIQARQTLSSHRSDDRKGSSLIIISFNDLQKIHTENFKNGDEMFAVRAMMQETIKQLNAVAVIASDPLQSFRFLRVVLLKRGQPLFLHPIARALVENFYLIKCSLEVLGSTPLDLECYIGIILDIFR